MDASRIKRGEVWVVNLNPTRGDEMRKTRPCVVITADGLGRLQLKTVVPITGASGTHPPWHVALNPDRRNGLSKPSVADALQLRTISVERFIKKLGYLPAVTMEEIGAAILIALDIR